MIIRTKKFLHVFYYTYILWETSMNTTPTEGLYLSDCLSKSILYMLLSVNLKYTFTEIN